MISKHEAIAVLNELLALEQRQMSLRFTESTVFISRLSVDEAQVVERLNSLANTHAEQLCEAIIAAGGYPGMRVGDIHTAHLHFQELQTVWPVMLDEHEKMVAAYRMAAERLSAHPQAARIVGQIFSDHQESLERIREVDQANQTSSDAG